MICDKCGWPMVTRIVKQAVTLEMTHFPSTYYLQSTCTKNGKHQVVTDMDDQTHSLSQAKRLKIQKKARGAIGRVVALDKELAGVVTQYAKERPTYISEAFGPNITEAR